MKKNQTGSANLFPFVLVIAALVGMGLLINYGPKPTRGNFEQAPPQVYYAPAETQNHTITLISQGVVTPSTEIELATDVTGTIIDVSPKLVNGSFFNKGDVLLTLDSSLYEAEVARATSLLETARLSLTQAKSRGAQALITEAEARLRAMQVGLKQAQSQLEKTKIKAPFDGRVRERRVGLGQFVSPGFPLARLYATNEMTVRLPLAAEFLELVYLPMAYEKNSTQKTSKVSFVVETGGKRHSWSGQLTGIEGAVNERNRLQFLLSVIPEPFRPDSKQPNRPLLAAGQFLKAEIEGVTLENVIKLPRYLLRTDQQIVIINEEDRLELRKVSVKYRGRNDLYLDGGVESGERIVMIPLGVSVSGARVTPVLFELSESANTSDDAK